jgi:hypothetical protein
MTNNTEQRRTFEEWDSVALEAMHQQYLQAGALSAERLSRGAIGAYINALEHELRAALSQQKIVETGMIEDSYGVIAG